MLWCVVQVTLQQEEEIKITPLQSSMSGIYFDHVGYVYLYPSEWKIVTYVDLLPAKDLWQKTKNQLVSLNEICKQIADKNWYPYTDCKQSLAYFNSQRKTVDRLKDIVSELMNNDSPQSGNSRDKRGILNFVGKISSILFGTATEEEIKKNRKNIETLEQEQKEFLRITKDQMLVLKSTLLTMNSTLRNVNSNEKRLRDVMLNITKESADSQSALKYELEMSMTVNELISQIQRGVEETQRTFDLLIDVYLHSQDGILQPQIITMQRIKTLMSKEALPERTIFPPFPSAELLSIVKPTIYTQENYLVYIVKLPLLIDVKYMLYKMVRFPIILESKQVALYTEIHKDYIFSDALGQQYGNLDISECDKPNSLTYVCMEKVPIQTNKDENCYANLLHPSTTKIPDMCTTKYIPLSHIPSTLWIPLAFSNEWLYVTPKPERITVVCPEKKNTYLLENRGKLMLNQKCHGITSKSVLYPITHEEKNNTKDDVFPSIPNWDIDCCISIPQQEKLDKLPINIPLNNILSPNDLNVAGYRIDEIEKLVEQQEQQSHKLNYQNLNTWYYYLLMIFGIIMIWILCCCCCTPCSKCSFWLLRQCSPKRWCTDCKSLTVNKYQHVGSVNYISESGFQGVAGGSKSKHRASSPTPSVKSLPCNLSGQQPLPEHVELKLLGDEIPKSRRSLRLNDKGKEKESMAIWKKL